MKKHFDKLAASAKSANAKMATGALMLVAGAGSAHATETSSAADQAFTTLETNATDMADKAWPVVATVVGSLLAIGLFKKFANKAT